MTNYLNNLADELGLASIGVAPAINDVRLCFPWAESVITTAVSYLPPDCQIEDDLPRGLIARVARSGDYHCVLREKLSHLVSHLRLKHPQARIEICVDTSPIPERKLAVLGGIAWQGKSGNVFIKGCGSYAALGEIVTDIKLAVSEPSTVSRCGECDKCMCACPTGAIIEPGVLDRSRCLSHLTQAAGIIPRDLRHFMQNCIYGCDVCQEVCPQNASVKPVSPEFALLGYPGACPELIPLINLSADEYKANLRDSSIGWIRRTRIRRNAAIAAGNLKCESAVDALDTMIRDGNSILRIHAAWALGEIGSDDALHVLNKALESEQDADVIKEIRLALSK